MMTYILIRKWYDSCSDEHRQENVGVFRCLDSAESAMAVYGSQQGRFDDDEPYEYFIEEHVLDETRDMRFGPVFVASLDLFNGNITIQEQEPARLRHTSECEFMGCPSSTRIVVKSPISPDHAIEAAIGKRDEWFRGKPVSDWMARFIKTRNTSLGVIV